MALRLAGEEYVVVQGLDDQGRLRTTTVSDGSPAQRINQKGAGDLLSLERNGTELFDVDKNGNVGAEGLAKTTGVLEVVAVAAPAAPTVTPVGTTGATTYTYKVTATVGGKETEVSAAASVANGNATLSATNYNKVDWAAVVGATGYKVYRTAGGATQGVVATVTDRETLTLNDTGLAGGGEAAPTVNTTGVAIIPSLLTARGADIPSAAALTLGGDGDFFHVTGTTTIMSISARPAGAVVTLVFDGALTLTHNATSLILQGNTNLTTAAGDVITLVSEGSGNWRELSRRLAAATGGGAPTDATYITQTPSVGLSAEQAMSALATGLLKNTTGTGVQSIATPGSDYYAPGSTDVAVADGGTGASDAATARTNLGLGTLATKATVATADIDNDAVTYAKLQNVSATDKVLGRATAGAGDVEEIAMTAAGRALVDDADAAAQRTTLALGTIATVNSPVPIANGGTGLTALGTALQVLRVNAGATALEYAAGGGAGAVTRAGGNTTEATTTSTTAVSLLTTTSLSITANVPWTAKAMLRHTSGAAATTRYGVMLNATEVRDGVIGSDATNEAQGGLWLAEGYANPAANYGKAGFLETIFGGAGSGSTAGHQGWATADAPAATIIDIIVRAFTNDALITIGADEMHVYTYAVS